MATLQRQLWTWKAGQASYNHSSIKIYKTFWVHLSQSEVQYILIIKLPINLAANIKRHKVKKKILYICGHSEIMKAIPVLKQWHRELEKN